MSSTDSRLWNPNDAYYDAVRRQAAKESPLAPATSTRASSLAPPPLAPPPHQSHNHSGMLTLLQLMCMENKR
ncbi:hypothetical protein Hypma_015678 [Hypsizygus marmoreus]|uniref:Uncharacterized protein n=1 Tax=Hypsizygus marmoreus TaxID=39966 RepID=A0A369K4I8_HYPMA|nr:hypothetical protein Hypma_015678 [Hypsizygus marmoreus]